MSQRLKIIALDLLLVAVLVGAWLFATGPGGVSPIVLPPLPDVLERLGSLLQESVLWSSLALTLAEILVAFVIATTLGLAIGFLCSRTELRVRVAEPLLAWGYMAPMVLFYPLLILWTGVGPPSKVFYASINAFFPIAFNSLRGFRAVDPRYLRVARAFGASPTQTDRLVKVQAALPMVLSGVRIGAALTIISVILAEMLASERGMGYQLAMAGHTLQGSTVFAFIAVLLVVVAALQLVVQRFGRAPQERHR
jgi:ABC-type nitrate/sulfonate/bicarbonate transport system permease component